MMNNNRFFDFNIVLLFNINHLTKVICFIVWIILETAVERDYLVQQINLDSVTKNRVVTLLVMNQFFVVLDELRCCAGNRDSTAVFRIT